MEWCRTAAVALVRNAIFLIAVISLVATGTSANAQVKIGFLVTTSGPGAAIGRDLIDGFKLGIRHGGGKLGGVPVELIIADDQAKPDVGRQAVDKMIDRDRIDILSGLIWSNVLLAVARPALDAGIFVISANAGPSVLAGKRCHPNFFAASWQNDNVHEAMGHHAQKSGYKRVYIMAPNYPAGRDALAGFKRFYKGEIAGEVYTQFGQLDYAAEIAQLRAAKPDATYFFYPGGMGINFVRQYAQAGLTKEIPLLGPSFSLDQIVLPAAGDAAIGALASTFWSEKLPNPANKRFVADFEAAHERIPSPFAAQAYDTARLIGSALKATGGRVDNKDAFRAAMLKADIDSVRGSFKLNTNHFPIQSYYLTEIVKDEKGRLIMDLRDTLLKDHGDAYVGDCKMGS